MSKAPAVSANNKLYKTSVSDTATSFITFHELNVALLLAYMSLNNSTYFFSRSINLRKQWWPELGAFPLETRCIFKLYCVKLYFQMLSSNCFGWN